VTQKLLSLENLLKYCLTFLLKFQVNTNQRIPVDHEMRSCLPKHYSNKPEAGSRSAVCVFKTSKGKKIKCFVGVYMRGSSRGPCTATILPTLLGFGGIQWKLFSNKNDEYVNTNCQYLFIVCDCEGLACHSYFNNFLSIISVHRQNFEVILYI